MAGGMSEAGGRHSRVEGVRHQIGLLDADQICFRPLTQPLPPTPRVGCNTGQLIQFLRVAHGPTDSDWGTRNHLCCTEGAHSDRYSRNVLNRRAADSRLPTRRATHGPENGSCESAALNSNPVRRAVAINRVRWESISTPILGFTRGCTLLALSELHSRADYTLWIGHSVTERGRVVGEDVAE